jgi:sulfur-carrier protein
MRLLYFAWIRERVGTAAEEVTPPASVATPEQLATWLAGKGDNYASALARRDGIKVAVNQAYVPWDHPLKGDDEVAFFPPVTGG